MHDYSEFTHEPSAAELERLDRLIGLMVKAKRERDQAAYARIAQYEVPEAMLDLGRCEHTTADGTTIVIEESPSGRVRSGRRQELYDWLEHNGHAEVLSKVRGPFKSGSAQRRAEQIQLHALAISLLKSGEPTPLDLLGISRTHVAKIQKR